MKKPCCTSKKIFEEAGIDNISKTSRNRFLKTIGKQRRPIKKVLLTPRHKKLRYNWALRYMKTNMEAVIFTDETRVCLDGPDNWSKGWVENNSSPPVKIKRQQGGGGIMIWAGIIDNELIGPVRIKEGVKINSISYCELLKNNFFPWIKSKNEDLSKRFIFMHDNAPSHASKHTKSFLEKNKIFGENLMIWPPNSPDINPIENFWGILKRKLYENNQKYATKDELWSAIVKFCNKIDKKTIKSLTSSVDNRLITLIQNKGNYINK